jgi:hypothetical protein
MSWISSAANTIINVILLHVVQDIPVPATFGSGDGEFKYTYGIATFLGNSILVSDSVNGRLQEMSRVGDFITK